MKKRLLVLLILAALLGASMTVSAARQYQTRGHIQVEGGDLWVCDTNGNGAVDAEDIHLKGEFWFNGLMIETFDENDNLLMITWMTSFHGLLTNLNTGEVVARDRFEGRETLDPATAIYTQSGATRHFFRPGEGSLYHDAGRIVAIVDLATGQIIEVLEEFGPHPIDDSGTNSFCDFIDGAGPVIFWQGQPSTVKVLGPA